jgi:hypothetical protein
MLGIPPPQAGGWGLYEKYVGFAANGFAGILS